MVNHPILEETHQFLHINARLHRVLAPGIEEIVLLLAVVQAGHIAMLTLAIHNARSHNRQFAVCFLCLPNLVDFSATSLLMPYGVFGVGSVSSVFSSSAAP